MTFPGRRNTAHEIKLTCSLRYAELALKAIVKGSFERKIQSCLPGVTVVFSSFRAAQEV